MTSSSKWRVLAACVAVMLGAGCSSSDEGKAPSPGAPSQASEGAILQQKEAPQLAKLVAAGMLPPLKERLPRNPRVIQPVERLGKYGGTWRLGLRGGADHPFLGRVIGYENLVAWDLDWKEIIPNVAESFEVNDNATEFTFKLREGLRWSDGVEYTADDIVFWYEDVFMNRELTPVQNPWFMSGGKPPVVEKIDRYTVMFRFAAPHGLFLQRLAAGEGDQVNRYPKHYLKRYHIKYNPEGIDALVKEAGASDWVDLFRKKGAGVPGTPYQARWYTEEFPTLYPWVMKVPYGKGTRVVAERNPYYGKVDPAGRQLPYIDRLVFTVADETETLVLKALNGEIDMQSRHIGGMANKPLYVDNMRRGDYKFFEVVSSSGNSLVISLNMTHDDPEKRRIFQNKDFRIGLSHAINRGEIIDLFYMGRGVPCQPAPRPESPHYFEPLSRQYTEYDPEKAVAHLEKAGFTQRDAEGFRLGRDGKRFTFSVEVAGPNATLSDMLELIRGYWAAVGIDMQIKPEDRSLFQARTESSKHDAVVWGGDGGLGVILEPRWYFPINIWSFYAVRWGLWYNKDSRGEKPPAPALRQMELYDQIRTTVDPEEHKRLMRQILEIARDQFYVMGIVLPSVEGYGIVRNNFHNVPERMYSTGGAWPNPGPTNPPQYFIDN